MSTHEIAFQAPAIAQRKAAACAIEKRFWRNEAERRDRCWDGHGGPRCSRTKAHHRHSRVRPPPSMYTY